MDIIKYDFKIVEDDLENKMKILIKKCPECETAILIYDKHREELYCSKCGLILKDNSFLTFQEIELEYNLRNSSAEET